MPIYRTGKPRSGKERDATINEKGNIQRSSTYDYETASSLKELKILMEYVVLHLQSMTNEDFNTDDTKGLI